MVSYSSANALSKLRYFVSLMQDRHGMVFQNPDNQIVANVVEEDVAFGPENLGISSPEIRNRVDKALKQVGMYEYREHAPHLLSGGQKQRLCIARALLKKPKILILDDSVSAVDTKTEKTILNNLRRVRQGKTTILIAHRISTIEKMDKILFIEDGCLAGVGSHQQLYATNAEYRKMVDLQRLEEEGGRANA